ncbi:MAG: site-specific DNA-methyltransferase [Saprospiraceae bacterium]|nr:site-specific DNA-methyltransferase [Saprospiraceae bacterium]
MNHFLDINKIHYGYSEDLIKQIEPQTVACSIWSPPYHLNKDYEKNQTFEEWQLMLQNVIHCHFPILRNGGFMIVNIADILCFADEAMPKIQMPNPSKHKVPLSKEEILSVLEANPKMSRYDLADYFGCSEQTIDRRLNGNNIRGGKYFTQTRVELVGHYLQQYAKEAGLFLYDRRIWKKDPSWHNSKWTSNSYRSVDEFEYLYIFWKPGETLINKDKLTQKEWTTWGSRAVWEFPSVRANNEHDAMFPIELPLRCIKLFTEKDDLVLDPFMGSGTTAKACLELKRNYIGIEKEFKYVELANNKLKAYQNNPKLPFYDVV